MGLHSQPTLSRHLLGERPCLIVSRGTFLTEPGAVRALGKSDQPSEVRRSGGSPILATKVFHVEHSPADPNRRAPEGRLSRSVDGSRIARSYKEDAPQGMWHGDRLAPFPRGNLSNLSQLLRPNPQDHCFGSELLRVRPLQQ